MQYAIRDMRRPAFSLVELVIVIVIIGVIAAIAMPRFSRGVGRAADVALAADLSMLRKAIQVYQAEHENRLPKKKKDFVKQMTMYTDVGGGASSSKTTTHIYGPYLQRMPPLPLGKQEGKTGVVDGDEPGDKNGGGWWYDKKTGEIRANLEDKEVDSSGTPYNQY